MTADSPRRREVLGIYLAVVAALYVLKLVLVFLVFPENEPNVYLLKETSKSAMYLAPLIISWRLAGRLRRALKPNEIADATGWCALAEFVADIVSFVYIAISNSAGVLELPPLTKEVVAWFPLVFVIRYAVVLIIAWVVLNFPGKWIAAARARRLNAAA